MKKQALIEKILQAHNPKFAENTRVTSIWYDGEITSEKGGELFGMRTCHSMKQGLPQLEDGHVFKSLLLSKKDMPVGGRAYVSDDDANMLRAEIKNLIINYITELAD